MIGRTAIQNAVNTREDNDRICLQLRRNKSGQLVIVRKNKFLDGNNVKISGKDSKPITAYYKEMGFEDARSRKPNKQWELIRLLAENNGELSWDKSEAKGDIKKKKQLLSKTLRDYFGIKGDPFYPYKEQNSYRIKISLTPESDSQ